MNANFSWLRHIPNLNGFELGPRFNWDTVCMGVQTAKSVDESIRLMYGCGIKMVPLAVVVLVCAMDWLTSWTLTQ